MSVMLSVIVPVHNAERYVGRCLDALLLQDVERYEIICVENGSTDGTLDVLRRYEKEHEDVVRVCVNREVGVSSARNRGMELARGEVLAFCDADDCVIPGAYGYLLREFWNDNIDVLKFNSVTLDKYVLRTWHESGDVRGNVVYEGSGQSFMRHLGGIPTFVWCNMYRKTFLEKKGIRFEPIMIAEDVLFNLNVCMADAHVCAVTSNVYRYTMSPEQVTRAREREKMKIAVRCYLKVFEAMASHMKQCPDCRDVLEMIMEQQMLPCFSRVFSAGLSRDEFRDVRARFSATGVFSIKKKLTASKVIDCAMASYPTYSIMSSVYRNVFVPYVLPMMRRN